MRGFSGKRILAVLVAALAVSLWALMSAPVAQAAQVEKPVVQMVQSTLREGGETGAFDGSQVASWLLRLLNQRFLPAVGSRNSAPLSMKLKGELLDVRAAWINRWMTATAIFLGTAGFIAFQVFQDDSKAMHCRRVVADAKNRRNFLSNYGRFYAELRFSVTGRKRLRAKVRKRAEACSNRNRLQRRVGSAKAAKQISKEANGEESGQELKIVT